ncbi:MAG: hypothetical protein ACSI46_20020 [Gloeotrichia echinulata DVL01]|nr:hypothetical protein [Gloeotrichia echinulata DEX184]
MDAVGEQLGAVKTLLQQDTALQELAKSPLTLSVMTLAYQGKKVKELPQTDSVEARREHLFNSYIERMFKRKGVNQQYPKDLTVHWLTWLAQHISQSSQTVFLIEQIQPTWLQSDLERILYKFEMTLIGILAIGLILLLGYGLDHSFYEISKLPNNLNNLPKIISMNAGMWGLVLIIWGLVLWLNFGRGEAEIKTFETLTYPWKKTQKHLLNGLIYGLKWSLVLSLFCVLWCYVAWTGSQNSDSRFNKIIIFGLITGLILGLIIGLIHGLKGAEIETKNIPNQGIWSSAKNAAIIAGFSWLILGLIIFFPPPIGLFPKELKSITSVINWGLILGLLFGGGIACIQHFSLRLLLWVEGFIPMNYARFLNYASDRIFLQKVGGGYIFVHRMLLEHFAGMK